MDSYVLSSQYELTAAGGTDIPQRPSVSFHGDFGAGLRTLDSDAGVRGDYATGTRITSTVAQAGDYATGLRAHPAAEQVRGDFATGHRGDRSDSPRHQEQPTHGLPAPVPAA